MSKTELPPEVLEARAEAARNAERARRLLREYSRKLHDIADRLWTFRRQWADGVHITRFEDEARAILRRRRMIASSIESFARVASGMIEQGSLDRQFKAELVVRLREAENALDEAREAAELFPKFAPSYFPAKLLEDVGLPELKTVRYAVG